MDFNNALTEPITKHLAGSWEYAFSHYLSERLDILDESPIKKSFASFRKGCFKRMKAHIIQYVDEERERMFQQTTKETETALKGTIDNGESAMRTKVEEIVTPSSIRATPQSLSVARNEVYELLGQVDDCFKEALQGTAEPVKSIQPDETAATTIDSEATAAHEQNAAAQASTSPADISISDSINYGVPDAVFVKRKAAPAGDPTGGVSIKRE
ncbi:hypothetical protein N0V88_001781 [Collariella sp. IMI 366227]|nr:hypothetical protein N0V88_001781 [Collariella sp. IMI 366227]